MTPRLLSIRAALREAGLDGWLFYDFRGSDPLARLVLGLPAAGHSTRRWFYLLPADGEPVRVVHAIEPAALDALPGSKHVYWRWQELHDHLRAALAGKRRVAMQYSPMNAIPVVSKVDAGTVELVRSLGPEVVTSADLIQRFAAVLDEDGEDSHRRAAKLLGDAILAAFDELTARLRANRPVTEHELQTFLTDRFAADGMVTDHPPIVAVNAHAADPHFAPSVSDTRPVQRGDVVLIDAWAKLDRPRSIFADYTWMGFCGDPPADVRKVFTVVRDARDAALSFLQTELAAGRAVTGAAVDDACRRVIDAAGYGEFFVHRTGHSIHELGHGHGANVDNMETEDARSLIARTCFSIEPGIYLPGRFGVRSEINVFMADEQTAEVTGPAPQRELLRLG